MKKKLITIILSLIMVLAMIPVTTGIAFADSPLLRIGSDYMKVNTDAGAARMVTMEGNEINFQERTYSVSCTKEGMSPTSITIDINSDATISEISSPFSCPVYLNVNANLNINQTSEYIDGISHGGDLYININSGSVTINSAYRGIAVDNLTVTGGNVDIKSTKVGVFATSDIIVGEDASISVLLNGSNITTDKNSIPSLSGASIDYSNFAELPFEYISGTSSHIETPPECITADGVSYTGTTSGLKYVSICYYSNISKIHVNSIDSQFTSKADVTGTNGLVATDVIYSPEAGVTITLNGKPGIKYPETWEPYYETLALKIAASAEIEAAKMLEEAKADVGEPVVSEKLELVTSSEETVAPNGKNSVKVTWVDKNGKKLTFDGYDCYRASNNGEYKFMFNTTNEWYYNTLIRKGQRYSYKVKGYNVVNGEKVYSEFSTVTTTIYGKKTLFKYGEITTIEMSDSTKAYREGLRALELNSALSEEYYPTAIAALEGRTTQGFPTIETVNKIEKIEYKNGDTYTFIPEKVEAIVFYIHGGAYVYEIDPLHVAFCDKLATNLNAKVYIPDYPLAPQYTYKEAYALLDEVYDDLLSYNLPIYIMGDSAGGGFTLAFTEYLKSQDKEMPSKLVLLSPWVDITTSNEEIPLYEKVDLSLKAYAAIQFGKLWAGDLDTKDPLVSPLYGDFNGLPDTLIFCGTDEIMWPDNEILFNKMKDAGVNVAMIRGEGLWHVYPVSNIEEQKLCLEMIEEHVR